MKNSASRFIRRGLSLSVVLASLCAGAANVTYTGPRGGSWAEAANWTPKGAPGAADEVLIVDRDVVLEGSATIASLTLKGAATLTVKAHEMKDLSVFAGGFDGVKTALWKEAATVTVKGRLTLEGTSKIYPTAAEFSGVPVVFRTKDLYVAEGTEFNAVKRGWGWNPGAIKDAPKGATPRRREGRTEETFWTLAPGAGVSYSAGAKSAYQPKLAPFLPGSPSGNYYAGHLGGYDIGRGPGSIILYASGAARIDGALVADADFTPNVARNQDGGRPCGGGILLGLNKFAFGPTARLSARGGSPVQGNQFGPGEGGRIAVAMGVSFAELEKLALGGEPKGFEVIEAIDYVAASVKGGAKPDPTKGTAADGSVVTLKAPGTGTIVSVGGYPVAVAVNPAGGARAYPVGSVKEFTAPEKGLDLRDSRFEYTCVGYVLSNATSKIEAKRTNVAKVKIGKEKLSLTWIWGKKTYAPRSHAPEDATTVALLDGNEATYAAPLAIAGTPEALGVEFDGDAKGAKIELQLVTGPKKTTVAFTIDAQNAFTLAPLEKDLTAPFALAGVKVSGTAAKPLSVRAHYREPLGRSARHFASIESRSQKLGGKIAAAKEPAVELAAGSHVRFVLHKSKGTQLQVEWSTGFTDKYYFGIHPLSEALLADAFGQKKGTKFTIEDAAINYVGQIRQYVRPYLRPYRSNSDMVPMGYDYLADWRELPPASEHVTDLRLRKGPNGTLQLWIDGSFVYTITPSRAAVKQDAPAPVLKGVRLAFGEGAEYAAAEPEKPAYDENRYEVLDLAANPRAKAFKDAKFLGDLRPGLITVGGAPVKLVKPLDSGDVAICHQGKGSWALEVDEYTGRSPLNGFGAAVHFRVPARDYIRAHVAFALDPDEKKDRVLNLRLAHYILNGAGSNMIGDREISFKDGIPAGVKKIGSLVRGGIEIPVYAMTVNLNPSPVVPEAARGGYLDFEFMGAKQGMKPDPKRESAFNVFGVTLESAPVTLDVVSAPEAPCNVFTIDEAVKKFTLRLRGEREASTCEVEWKAKAFGGKEVFSGKKSVGPLAKGAVEDIAIDVAGVKEEGLYLMDVLIKGDGGAANYSHQTRFAILPESGRLVKDPSKSPYATWWFFGSHGSPNDWSVGGPILQKAGIRRSCHKNWSKEMIEKYSVTYTGQVGAPSQGRFFDAATGHFKPQGNLSGEEWFVTNITQQIAAVPYVDHVNIWHESGPRGGIPEEILGLPVPAATDSDRAAGAYVNECGRLIRKYFPKLRLQIGNNSASLGHSYLPFRGGAKAEYYDSMGIETPSQTMMPERLLVWGLQGMVMTREAASFYAKRPVPNAACFEYVYRTERAIGEELQAAWYMRDVLISLANEMPMISPAVTFDVKNAYYDTLWGRAGMLKRAPYCEPKLSYVAYAALTKALDGVKYLGELDTGSTTTYALSFRRADGKYATAVWCARGEAVLDLDVGGDFEVMDMVGRRAKKGGLFSGKRVEATEWPAYVISEKPVKGVTIAKRGFAQAEAASAKAKTIYAFGEAGDVTVDPDRRAKSKGHGCLPMMEPSDDFSVKTVQDDEKGRVLEVALDVTKRKVNKYFTEYSTVHLKNPATIPEKSAAIGVWVKGNSSWGQVRFEVTDAAENVWVNYSHATLWDTLDWQGMLCVNFDGWGYISCKLPDQGGLEYDRTKGLINSPWTLEVRGKGPNAGKFSLPAKLTAVTVGINREKLDILDFKKTDPRIRLGEVKVEAASAKKKGGDDVKIVIFGAEAD